MRVITALNVIDRKKSTPFNTVIQISLSSWHGVKNQDEARGKAITKAISEYPGPDYTIDATAITSFELWEPGLDRLEAHVGILLEATTKTLEAAELGSPSYHRAQGHVDMLNIFKGLIENTRKEL